MSAQFIRLDVNHPLEDGMDIIFNAPCNCPEVAGLAIFYNNTRSVFTFRDAHKNDLSELPSFTVGARIKVNLDTVNGYAYLQNADTNAYLEMMFKNRLPATEGTGNPGCYYRMVGGEKEYINPPMRSGVEYRTTERFAGEPVYAMLIIRVFTGSMNSKGELDPITLTHEVTIRNVTKMWIDSGLYTTDGGTLYGCSDAGSNIAHDHYVSNYKGNISITCNTNGGIRQVTAYVLAKYTKAKTVV